jgi:trans-2,3-dihydro-3-hydroxyanthranilate isomerase
MAPGFAERHPMASPKSLAFHTLDVFTDQRRAGNPLAVVHGADDLDDETMQAVAREFNLSETVFVMAPTAGGRSSVRIFTPGQELPFAGHPTVGTAVLLALLDAGGVAGARTLVLEERIGPVTCDVTLAKEDRGSARFSLPRLPLSDGSPPPLEDIANAVGLAEEDLVLNGHAPACWSAGVGYLCVPVRDMVALSRARPGGVQGFDHLYLYTPATGAGADWRARMFAEALGVVEDPATGSAAAAFAGQLMACAKLNDGHHVFSIAQGVEMRRPSRIALDLDVRGGALVAAGIAGEAVVVSQGRLTI